MIIKIDGIKYNSLKLNPIFPIEKEILDDNDKIKSNLTASLINVADKYQIKINDNKFSFL
jgi:hypothetical protein